MGRATQTPTLTSRKGVSPLIAAVLLIAFTMAVAAILTAWVTTFTQDTTGAVGEQGEELLECQYAGVSVYAANWDGSDLAVTVANTGTVDLNGVTIYAFRSAAVQGQANITDLEAGSLEDTTIDGLSEKPERVRLSSSQCSSVTAEETDISG